MTSQQETVLSPQADETVYVFISHNATLMIPETCFKGRLVTHQSYFRFWSILTKKSQKTSSIFCLYLFFYHLKKWDKWSFMILMIDWCCWCLCSLRRRAGCFLSPCCPVCSSSLCSCCVTWRAPDSLTSSDTTVPSSPSWPCSPSPTGTWRASAWPTLHSECSAGMPSKPSVAFSLLSDL